jgi:hypothetical protein
VVLCSPISVYLTYLLVRLSVKPDEITFTSIAMQFAAAAAFVLGAPLAGAIVFQVSFLLDCSDGKVATSLLHGDNRVGASEGARRLSGPPLPVRRDAMRLGAPIGRPD